MKKGEVKVLPIECSSLEEAKMIEEDLKIRGMKYINIFIENRKLFIEASNK